MHLYPISCILYSQMFRMNQHKKTVRKNLKRRIQKPAGAHVSCFVQCLGRTSTRRQWENLGYRWKGKYGIQQVHLYPVSCYVKCLRRNNTQENSEEKAEKENTGASRWTCIGQPTFSLLIWKVHTFYLLFPSVFGIPLNNFTMLICLVSWYHLRGLCRKNLFLDNRYHTRLELHWNSITLCATWYVRRLMIHCGVWMLHFSIVAAATHYLFLITTEGGV